ncbi:ubiquitin carboxyl-terminal hydrolase MINDY-3 [Solanum pennellii]|uniref:ubiquitinyl hydrolase 1 n=1 Tax=Solanum pennellii TaxID=28526 RepID=A0ABM1GNW0_SOLPN|nr:ubiquitin carboxyl-terminal hydrolase MINDY-3 [Solanum pennellii]
MADQEDEELKMALRMSMQKESPEPKRSKPGEEEVSGAGGGEEGESPEVKNRRRQRELMAAAAEKRMLALPKNVVVEKSGGSGNRVVECKGKSVNLVKGEERNVNLVKGEEKNVNLVKGKEKNVNLREELPLAEANELFSMIFGCEVTKDILGQWTNQGIRFSPDPDTSMGLVQHEGGPCGVLAAIQAFVLKHLLFFSDDLNMVSPSLSGNVGLRRLADKDSAGADIFSSLSEEKKSRALVRGMCEILFMCGSNRRVVIASLRTVEAILEGPQGCSDDEVISKALEGLSIESGANLQKALIINTYTSSEDALQRLEALLPVFRSRMGAMLFLISALLSHGMESVQADRDDPSQPLVTAPFGHASQEIVNLLLSGEAVANVFDGRMDLGGGMFVKGISTKVEVGFITLLESLNFCKVGLHLKCPTWPIWVVGSESHYTVLFALDTKVQEENELEGKETKIRRAFDAQDQSGGGGFISVEGFHQVLRDTNVNLPADKLQNLCSSGYIVWSEFWQVLLDLDKSLGGLKDPSGLMGKKVFDLYHFNGIAKSVMSGNQVSSGNDFPVQRPRLTKLRVSVPPRWTPEEFMSSGPSTSDPAGKDSVTEVSKPEPSQHAPLVDCIRTRWARATCTWEGDPPSIV